MTHYRQSDNELITEYINFVIEDLMEISGIQNMSEIRNMVNGSVFAKMLTEDIEFVVHYSPRYWAEKIMKNRKGIYQYHY